MNRLYKIGRQVSALIANYNWSELTDTLEKLNPKKLNEKRIMLHSRGAEAIHRGDYLLANRLLEQALEYGENIGVIRDYTCSWYLLNNLTEWRKSLTEFENRFEKVKRKLSPESLHESRVMLAKFLEEQGEIEKSLNLYQESRSTLASQIQTLRLLAVFGTNEELNSQYSNLTANASTHSLSQDLFIELQHGLLLAEIHLVGLNHAYARLNTLLNDNNISEADHALIFYDFIEEINVSAFGATKICRQCIENFEVPPSSTHERLLLKICDGQHTDSEIIQAITTSTGELTFANYLRLMIVHYNICQDEIIKKEIKNKTNILLSTLPPESRRYWIQRFRSHLRNNEMKLKFDKHKKYLSFQNRHVDLKRKKNFVSIIETFDGRKEVSIEQAIESIWDSQYTPEHYQRLRMSVHRFNKVLNDLTASPKIIEIDADKMSLNHQAFFQLS